MKTIFLRYYLQSADTNGFKEHPITVMKNLGFTVVKRVPESIADLWFFEVLDDGTSVPDWLDIISDSVTELPEWPKNYL